MNVSIDLARDGRDKGAPAGDGAALVMRAGSNMMNIRLLAVLPGDGTNPLLEMDGRALRFGEIPASSALFSVQPNGAPEKVMQPHERVASLKRIGVLAALADDALARVARECKWREYSARESILGHEDASSDVLFLLDGRARVIIYSADGKAVLFTDLAAATMIGEIAAIDRMPRSAGVEALESCTIAALSADRFEALVISEPSVALATLRHLTAEVRRLSERVFEFSTMVVQNRIQAELVRLAGEAGATNGEAVLSPAPSLADIAGRVSTHREAVSRELSRLISKGLLRREHGDLKITNIAKLAKLVEEARGD
jgi:CRP/FNR family transcriptional regulator, cyclic AMP receptor protein